MFRSEEKQGNCLSIWDKDRFNKTQKKTEEFIMDKSHAIAKIRDLSKGNNNYPI